MSPSASSIVPSAVPSTVQSFTPTAQPPAAHSPFMSDTVTHYFSWVVHHAADYPTLSAALSTAPPAAPPTFQFAEASTVLSVSCTDDCAVSCPAVPSATLSTLLQPCRQPCCWPLRQHCHLLQCPPRRYHHRQSGLNCGSTVDRLYDGYSVDSSVCRATSHAVSCSNNRAARCVVKHAAISAINSAISCAINRAVTRTARLTSAVQPCHQ